MPERERLRARIVRLIDRLADGSSDEPARNALLGEVLAWQARHVPPYARLCSARLQGTPRDPSQYPALPTDAFRFARVAAHAARDDTRVFRTSGTSDARRGVHALRDLSLYDRAASASAKLQLFPDLERMDLLILAPSEAEAPDSSLSYMLSRFVAWFGAHSVFAWRAGALDARELAQRLEQACATGRPIALLGTSFAFVHADAALGSRRFALPRGSRIMQTGGFKGRSREVAAAELLALLAGRYGVAPAWIVQEYGMTELCSQMYEASLREACMAQRRSTDLRATGARALWVPGWVRAQPVDPQTLRPVPEGHEGLLRIDDLANLDSVCALQTSDRARRMGNRIQLLGRARGAVARGCSIAVDAALGKR
ncbi:MAG: acyl-protein synthetase [Proteobacteria bacterium]|nr:acyl-protein synthetase [Pseudomonadota bacterium]